MNDTFKTLLVIGLVIGTIMGVAALVLFGFERTRRNIALAQLSATSGH